VTGWRLIVPVKNLAEAKSRIDLDPELRRGLAAAMVTDVLDALSATSGVSAVIVCTADPDVANLCRSLGVRTFQAATGSLNGDLSAAARALGTGPLGVVMADLPCLTATDLAVVLAAVPTDGAAFVASFDGGTTMLFDASGAIDPRFGVESAARHGEVATDLTPLATPGLRRDVDSYADLRHARELGVGSATRAWAATTDDIELHSAM
jgi:2-phospho-L-lactate/phosphoenolpyruvate guanylyltransferase